MSLRIVLVLLAVTVLGSCANCDCVCSLQTKSRIDSRLAQFARLNMVSLNASSSRVVTCDPGKDCEVNITVIERPPVPDSLDPSKKTPTCFVDLGYCTLCVRGASAKSGEPVKVIWRLRMSDGSLASNYEFAPTTGIRVSYAGVTGRRDFHAPQFGANQQEFIWLAGPDSTGMLPHEAHVYPKGGGERCGPIDPDVINTH